MAPAGGGNIKVVVRVRPFNGREIDRGSKCIVSMKDNQTVLTPPDGPAGRVAKDSGAKTFAFDRSYWSFSKKDSSYAGQSNLFDDLGKPLLDNAFQGYNNCIFAYGQTGSGKSYSMMGYGKEVGIIPNICQEMFRRIVDIQTHDLSTKCTVEVSYLEIYNERVRDLLNPSTKGNLKVREHPSTGPYVEDLAKLVVGSFQEIEHLMDEGNKARTVAATNMNETSSRSHAVFTLMLTQKKHDDDTNMDMEKVAKISLVDLAGSERATSTGATGARLKEGAEINRSLSTLGRVIAALADLSTGSKKKKGTSQVPYRDSVLTWLLKDSLGGNSMTAMIAAISPADINYDETLSTLRYADSAKRIKNHAVINEDANARMIRELKEELALLRSKLGGGGAAAYTASGGGVDEDGTPLDQQMVTITGADGAVKKVSKADIAEQLSQSEKLLTDLNQTWEQKLQKTEEIHKEREAALEELGISIEKGFVGLHTPKKMPHLVNLSDDPLLAECLVYNLKPGTTTVGNGQANADHHHQAYIRLNGSRILHDHCAFQNAADGTVTVIPREGAAVMVNGKRVEAPMQLHSGYRVILGDFHIFRFNHPMEARAERAEVVGQSLLRQSLTASQIQALERSSSSSSPCHSPRLGHDRSQSKSSEPSGEYWQRSESPAPRGGRGDSDWSLARREAAGAMLGTDQNLASLTDEELNALFEDVQRARAERVNPLRDDGDDESVTSYHLRDKYMSTGTIDNFSLDTALTMPSTPKPADEEATEAAGVEEMRREKARMEAALEEMQRQLELQRERYEERVKRPSPAPARRLLTETEASRARTTLRRWRGRRFVKMAESVLQEAAMLKEAQIMSNELNESVVFQFTVVDVGHALCSSYDMVLNGLTGEGEDLALDEAAKPCIGIRVMDYRNSVVRLWSVDKLQDRLRQMRQMHQYLDQPEYAQHLSLDNAFAEAAMPSYTLIGEVDVPLAAVFESRVHDLGLEVVSPHTTHAVGMVRLSLEPSAARAPSSRLKFNVVMRELVGFAEREGSDVHAQLFIPGVPEEEGITTTQMIRDFDEGPIRFESVHNMSVPLSAPRDVTLRVALFARVSAMHLDKLTSWDDMRDGASGGQQRLSESQFLTPEKHDLLSRLQLLELGEDGEYRPVEVTQTSELDTGTFQLHQGLQRRIHISLSHSSGDALPWGRVTAVRVGRVRLVDSAGKTPDMGGHGPDVALSLAGEPVFRDRANGTRSVTLAAQWDSSLHNSLLLDRVTADRYRVQMTVSWEMSSDKLAEPMRFAQKVCVQILSRTFVRQQSVFTALFQQVRFVRWSTGIFTLTLRPVPVKRAGDLWRASSRHDYVKGEEKLVRWAPRGVSLVSDYIAARKRRRRVAEVCAMQTTLQAMGVRWQAQGEDESLTPDSPCPARHHRHHSHPPPPPPPLLPPPPHPTFPPHPPPPRRRHPDDDEDDDVLNDTPSTSQAPSISDRQDASPPPSPPPDDDTIRIDESSETRLLAKCLALWTRYPDPLVRILSPANTASPCNGIAPELPPSASSTAARLAATVVRVPKNPTVLRGGYLLVPSESGPSQRWVKRFVELRRPYLHIHSASDGDEVALVSLRNARVDSSPEVRGLLGHESARSRRLHAAVFAIYGTDNTWLFAARSERDKMDWIFRIDTTYLSPMNGSEACASPASC